MRSVDTLFLPTALHHVAAIDTARQPSRLINQQPNASNIAASSVQRGDMCAVRDARA
jgi:hypothetical protein